MNELAGLYSYRGRHDRAATLYRAALDIDRQALGNDHPQVGMHLQNLAVALHAQGKLEEAAPLYEESMQILQRVLGEQHPQTLDAAANYGRFLHRRGELARAEEVLEQSRRARPAGARAAARVRRSRPGQSRHGAPGHAAAGAGGAGFPRGAGHLRRDAAGRSSVRRVGAVGSRPLHARTESSRRSRADAAASEADRGEVRRRPTVRSWRQRTARSGEC